jgi:hypothetical protein
MRSLVGLRFAGLSTHETLEETAGSTPPEFYVVSDVYLFRVSFPAFFKCRVRGLEAEEHAVQ